MSTMKTRTRTVIRTFLASPGDVEEERKIASEVVQELNLIWSEFLGLQLELVRWETHAYPGVGAYPQAVINEMIGDDYELFIGIMWNRFGTPTPIAGSGTEEEFQRAVSRARQNPGSVQIMLYFKSASAKKLDKAQLEKVRAFRSRITDQGVLYWTFDAPEAFRNLLRMHLSRQMQVFVRSERGAAAIVEVSPESLEAYARRRKMIEGEMLAKSRIFIPQLTEFRIAMQVFGSTLGHIGDELANSKKSGPLNQARVHGYAMRVAAAVDKLVLENERKVAEFNAAFAEVIEQAALNAPYLVRGHDTPAVAQGRIVSTLEEFQRSVWSSITMLEDLGEALQEMAKVHRALRAPSERALVFIRSTVRSWKTTSQLAQQAQITYRDLAL